MIDNINHHDFISSTKTWNLDSLSCILLDQIINDIRNIPILVTNIEDKLIWKFSNDDKFTVKIVMWANNDCYSSR